MNHTTPSTYLTSRGLLAGDLHPRVYIVSKLALVYVSENKQVRRKRTEKSLFPILKQFKKQKLLNKTFFCMTSTH